MSLTRNPERSKRVDSLHQDFAPDIEEFFRTYGYREGELTEFWTNPNDKTDIWIDMADVLRWNPEIRDIIIGEIDGYTYTDIRRLFEKVIAELDNPVDYSPDAEDVTVRFYNLNQQNSVGDYWSDDLGDFLAVSGQISKSTSVRPKYEKIAFECQLCGNITTVPQYGREVQEPNQCVHCERKAPYLRDEEESEATDHQMLIIEQPADELDPEEDPDEIVVEATGDMVKEMQEMGIHSGSRVTVNGILGTEEETNNTGANEWLLEAHSIEVNEDEFDPSNVSKEEREQIEELAAGEHGDPFELLAGSIAPSLKGHDRIEDVTHNGTERSKLFWIKALAGLCNLFQGWRRQSEDGTYVRGTSHVLLVGDPSTGKSTIMRAIEEISPRSAGASGKGASVAGLTAAAVRKDDFGDSQWQLEAGVLVKANGGVATIDELDKVPDQVVNSMHEALESQRVQISKAGIHATLQCETSVLAAANPKESRFNKMDTVEDQIEMVDSLLDRFDLIFALEDTPERERDRDMAYHVAKSRTESGLQARGDLESGGSESSPAIDTELVSKWATLAREYNPVIQDESLYDKIADFYEEVRDTGEDGKVPATARNLHALLRVAEASARMRLDDEITEYDVDIAIAGTLASLEDIGYDADLVETGQSKKTRDIRMQVRTIFENREEDGNKPTLTKQEIAEAAGWETRIDQKIQKLASDGLLYMPSGENGYRMIK